MASAAHTHITKMKMLATLLVGVAFLGAVIADQSELGGAGEQPISEQDEGKRQSSPEVVLQLKYDGGELNRIYLTQFRKPGKLWVPSVSVQTSLCEDLCHAGLGGAGCGPSCPALLPVGLQAALGAAAPAAALYGSPRRAVCPALCDNRLGEPLCQCAAQAEAEAASDKAVKWSQVCAAFCLDNYQLAGCPACEPQSGAVAVSSARALQTADGWQAWCNVQCPQGNGGLACNCDRSPF